jgi:hypothetical protein
MCESADKAAVTAASLPVSAAVRLVPLALRLLPSACRKYMAVFGTKASCQVRAAPGGWWLEGVLGGLAGSVALLPPLLLLLTVPSVVAAVR